MDSKIRRDWYETTELIIEKTKSAKPTDTRELARGSPEGRRLLRLRAMDLPDTTGSIDNPAMGKWFRVIDFNRAESQEFIKFWIVSLFAATVTHKTLTPSMDASQVRTNASKNPINEPTGPPHTKQKVVSKPSKKQA